MKKEFRQEIKKKVDIKNMSETEKNISTLFGKMILKKSIIPIILIFTTLFGSKFFTNNIWIRLSLTLAVSGAGFYYLKQYRDKLQQLKYYEGKVIYFQKKENYHELLLKNGKLPIKLTVKKGIDEKKIRKNQFLKLYYNDPEKVAIIVE
ncbi:hypothetical protein [Tepidibacter formicigenes]|jgi:ethanolamine utilization protein EutP (predicted NTPase)|uniref:Uncharacterized protein n=1 Tax=Tepidibacter formicigenes DSM 15518 TaxID=1123349 RepID=A0A1M6U948_9FIRM|nr:hypothetical protein [Tepidibacter formicigenes]SHK65714.1 hypothetical protein SAMN02744037_02758 [Tepidibacter formicigenes DSM 15518]